MQIETITCINCFRKYHQKCFSFKGNFICPICQLTIFSNEKDSKLLKFIIHPQFLFKPYTSAPRKNKLTFKISMNDLSPIKEENTFLMLSCSKITKEKSVFKWPRYCNIFINEKRLAWGREEFEKGKAFTPFVFYFRENIKYNKSEHLIYFCDWLYVDDENVIEFKQTYPDHSDELYTFSMWLCQDFVKDSHELGKNDEIKEQCICNGEEIKEYIEVSEDDEDNVEVVGEKNNVINLCDEDEDKDKDGDEENVNKEEQNDKQKQGRKFCDLCKSLNKEEKANKLNKFD